MKTKSQTTYINFSMDDIENPFSFEVKNAELEVTYTSYQKEDEKGFYGVDIDIDKINVTKIDGIEPTDYQADIILNLIIVHDKELKEMINDEVKMQKVADDQDYAEYRYDMMNDR